MNKHGILLNMINNSIFFSFRYYFYLGMPSVLVLTILIAKTKMISIITYQDILPNQILKNGLAEKIDNFLKIPKKISKKKIQLINISKQRQNILKMVIISILNKLGENNILISILVIEISTLTIKQINIAIIDANAYCATYRLQEAQFLLYL